jgi:broad specificity phosphatase PhoE
MAQPIKLYLVRHGRPRAGFAEAVDPELDEVGVDQARMMALALGPLGPLQLVTSPLKRARETARPLEMLWGMPARVEPAVAEIPAPTTDLQARANWVRQMLRQRWSDLPQAYQDWRNRVVSFLSELQTSTVITTHFVAINTAVGIAMGDDRVTCFEPDHCSCTVLQCVSGELRVVELGRQRPTTIL